MAVFLDGAMTENVKKIFNLKGHPEEDSSAKRIVGSTSTRHEEKGQR
jgi:hypothetical protein